MAAANYTVITISLDRVWAGSGKLIDGIISDCGAQLGADQDESEVVYEMIEEAIEDGKDSMTIEIEGKDTLVTWNIIEPMVAE